jgi:integrase
VELFRKNDSRFYWYDFKVRGKRYRGSTKETNKKRAGRIGALRLSQALGSTGLLDRKAPSLLELSTQFLRWVESATLASKTKKYYANGWRLLSGTKLVSMRLDHITKDDVDVLTFSGTAPSVNCALRTLRRMLNKAEEWNLLIKGPRFKLLPEHGRKLRLDDDAAEQKLLIAARSCHWKPGMFELFRDIIILARDTGMRNGRELYRIRTENLDWNNRDAASKNSLRGWRDGAMVGLLLGCGLRRSEVVGLLLDQLQSREGRWVIVNLVGKGGRIRTVPMPSWCKELVETWLRHSGVSDGKVFRRILK